MRSAVMRSTANSRSSPEGRGHASSSGSAGACREPTRRPTERRTWTVALAPRRPGRTERRGRARMGRWEVPSEPVQPTGAASRERGRARQPREGERALQSFSQSTTLPCSDSQASMPGWRTISRSSRAAAWRRCGVGRYPPPRGVFRAPLHA